MRAYILLFFVAISYGKLIDQYDSGYKYTMIGIDENDHEIDNCIFQCFENNCTTVSQNAFKCQNTQWIKFKSDTNECGLFKKWSYSLENYTVFAVDCDNNIDPNSMREISNYLAEAIDYGCGLLTLWPNAIYFGITLDELIIHSTIHV